jgi:hypothetical protein
MGRFHSSKESGVIVNVANNYDDDVGAAGVFFGVVQSLRIGTKAVHCFNVPHSGIS